MTLSITRFPWLWLSGKAKDQVSNGSQFGSKEEPESLKFNSKRRDDKNIFYSNSNGKAKRKWKSREERSRMTYKEHDVILVPSDGVCLSGSESDDSDWSIGWLEPLAPDFQCDDDLDDSFAVLVPCYRHDCHGLEEEKEEDDSVDFTSVVKNGPNGYSYEGSEYMKKWLSSLQKF